MRMKKINDTKPNDTKLNGLEKRNGEKKQDLSKCELRMFNGLQEERKELANQ